MAVPAGEAEQLRETPLSNLHRRLGARMVPFAGYSMPVQYPTGIIAEHRHTREAAGLFDVSHMGQAILIGPDHATAAAVLEALTPGDFKSLGVERVRYTLLLNEDGGVIDDLMVTRLPEDGKLLLVVNASRKDVDYAHIQERLSDRVRLQTLDDRALIALQGPQASAVAARHMPGIDRLGFMNATETPFGDVECHVSRSGYTGEDGFEISVPADRVEAVAEKLLAEPEVKPIGLGARDSLRLEAGLCLYGHDLTDSTSPVEADLGFAIAKRRREEGGFPGAKRILRELEKGPSRLRVGLLPEGPTPVRDGTALADGPETDGVVTSGGYGPTVGRPIAMGYVAASRAKPGTKFTASVRGKALPIAVHPLPFVPHRYYRRPA